jgi:hypothetical protein
VILPPQVTATAAGFEPPDRVAEAVAITGSERRRIAEHPVRHRLRDREIDGGIFSSPWKNCA